MGYGLKSTGTNKFRIGPVTLIVQALKREGEEWIALFVLSRRHNEKVADLFAENGKMFYGRAMKLTCNQHAAEDLVQSAMLELMKSLDKGSLTVCALDDEHLRYYVLGILRKLYYNNCRKNTREAEKLEKLKQDLNDGDVWDPDKALWEHERLDLLEWAVLQLPERYYEFLMLKYIHGFGKEELAEALGVKVTSLPMLQKRTVGLLRRLIREEDVAHAR